MAVKMQELKLDIERIGTVSAILTQPDNARACYVLAHGAGTDMRHASMDKIAEGLAGRGIATLRFNFPYMEKRLGRPDQPAVAHAAIRAAVEEAARLCPGLKLVAGGKSFGGRMTSQAQSKAPLP
ncbi:putative alpha/beta-hydrolase family hydrolase [Bradyrhizobium sp. S3.14.4]